MKKFLFVFTILIAMFLLYSYQMPIMSTSEAITSAEKHLQNPPKEWGKTFSNVEWNETPIENVSASLFQENNFWSNLTNRMNWEVTIKNNNLEPTVVIDAYTGKLIGIYGPVN